MPQVAFIRHACRVPRGFTRDKDHGYLDCRGPQCCQQAHTTQGWSKLHHSHKSTSEITTFTPQSHRQVDMANRKAFQSKRVGLDSNSVVRNVSASAKVLNSALNCLPAALCLRTALVMVLKTRGTRCRVCLADQSNLVLSCKAIMFQTDASSEVIVGASKVHFTIAQVLSAKTCAMQLSHGKERRAD